LTLNRNFIKHRQAKITPAKISQFFTFCWRIGKGLMMPYQSDDLFNFLVVKVRDKNHLGLFVFSNKMLSEKGENLLKTKKVKEL
jgi:hypothetical protein